MYGKYIFLLSKLIKFIQHALKKISQSDFYTAIILKIFLNLLVLLTFKVLLFRTCIYFLKLKL